MAADKLPLVTIAKPPLLTIANVADFEFFSPVQIEALAKAGGFTLKPEQLEDATSLMRHSFGRMLNLAFDPDRAVDLILVQRGLATCAKLRCTIGNFELLVSNKLPFDSIVAIEKFLNRAKEVFEERIKEANDKAKKRKGRRLESARNKILEHVCAIYELLSEKKPTKTKSGRSVKFVKAFFKTARSQLASYEFTSIRTEQHMRDHIWRVPSEDIILQAIGRYRARGPLLHPQSSDVAIAIFDEPPVTPRVVKGGQA